MSISDQLRRLEEQGAVAPYVPMSRQPAKRRLYLADQAKTEFDSPNSAVNSLVGKGFVEASMARWVLGGRVIGNKRRGLFVDRLDPPPPDIWEIRVTEPIVQARGLGCFAEPDTLVLLRLHTRGFMGNRTPGRVDQWDRTMGECSRVWTQLFPASAPLTGLSIKEFVSENFDEFPI